MLSLRAFFDTDMPLFQKWLTKDHVSPWFSPTENWFLEIEQRTGAFSFVHHFVLEEDGRPIGFGQYYDYALGGETWQGSHPTDGAYSLDYLIGEEDCLHRGCGGVLVHLLTKEIFEKTPALCILIQPEKENASSRRTLLHAGYSYDADNDVFYILRPKNSK